MYVIGNTGWTVDKLHRLDDDGVVTYFRLTFGGPLTDEPFAVAMSVQELKAFAARLVLEANDIDPRWDRP